MSKHFFQHCAKLLIIFLTFFSFPLFDVLPVNAESGVSQSVSSAAVYLANQSKQGDWVSAVGESGVDWAVMALSAAGALNQVDETTLTQSLQTFTGASATDYERKILAITAYGKDPRTFISGRNLMEEFSEKFYLNNQFGSESQVNDDFWAILALASTGEDSSNAMIQNAKTFILNYQNTDGGWGYAANGGSSDADNTSAAIMALLSAGESAASASIQQAVSYLQTQQNSDGGFSGYGTSISNTDSTSWASMAISKLGQDVNSWKKSGNSPEDFILSMQSGEGYFYWQESSRTSGVKANTSHAIIALLNSSFPVKAISLSKPLVSFRIEGSQKQVCSGSVQAQNVLEVVINAKAECGYTYELAYGDTYLEKLNNDEASGMTGWLYLVNLISGTVGAKDYALKDGDEVLWYYGDFNWLPLRVSVSDDKVSLNESVSITVETYQNGGWMPAAGASVIIGGTTIQTDANGLASYTVNSYGQKKIYSEKQGHIRSNQKEVSAGELSPVVDLKVVIKIPGGQSEEPEIAFTISGGQVDFGELQPGESAQNQSIMVANTGKTNLTIGGVVEGDDIFMNNLNLDGVAWENFQLSLDISKSKNLDLDLLIPSNYTAAGEQEGELTFWAAGED